MPELPQRGVIRDQHFERDLRALVAADPREADEVIEAAEFVLARDPLAGQETEFPPLWALTLPLARGEQQLVLYYTFDETTVLLLSIIRVG